MYIGKINEKLKVGYSVKNKLGKAVNLQDTGNPFSNERFFVLWKEYSPNYLDIFVSLERTAVINDVVLTLGDYCRLKSASLLSSDLKKVFAEHLAETGKTIDGKQIVLSLDSCEKDFVIRLQAELSNINLEGIELYGAISDGDEPELFPIPANAKYMGGSFPVSDYGTVFCDACVKGSVKSVLDEKLYEISGMKLNDSSKEEAKILLLSDGSLKSGGYRLSVGSKSITVSASDVRGFVQGVESLCKLIKDGFVRECEIDDRPMCDFRGVHLFLPAPDKMDFAKRLIKYVLSPMGYNAIIMEICGAMRFNSHPEINDAYLDANRRAASGEWPSFPHGSVAEGQIVEQKDIRELCAYAKQYGIDIIPEVQSLSHVQFLTVAHPEIGEWPDEARCYDDTDERLTDIPPNEFYAHCYCPENPLSYEILFDLIDEIVDTFKPERYVHIGHDEVYRIGVCPRCKDKDPAKLFEQDVMRIYNYLKGKGLDTMMWSDMLQNNTSYKTSPAREALPRDIIMLDFIWYFHMNDDIEKVLTDDGYSVIIGNLYSSHFPRYESRIRGENIFGGQISTWMPTSEEALAQEGKFYDILYTANMLWSSEYTSYARSSYDAIISGLLPHLRESIRNIPDVTLCSHEEKILWENDTDSSVEKISVGGCYDALVFEHYSIDERHREAWVPFEIIGEYTVLYANGESVSIPVTYGGNIGYRHRRQHQPLSHGYYRHNGYITSWETDAVETRSNDGVWSTVYRFPWNNPNPNQEIKEITYTSLNDGNVCVCRILGVKG